LPFDNGRNLSNLFKTYIFDLIILFRMPFLAIGMKSEALFREK